MYLTVIMSTTVMMIVDDRGDTVVIGVHANLTSATVNAARRLGHLVGGVVRTRPMLVGWSTIVRRRRVTLIGDGDRDEEILTVVVEVVTAATWRNDVVGVTISAGRMMTAAPTVEIMVMMAMTSVTITTLVWVPGCDLQWQIRRLLLGVEKIVMEVFDARDGGQQRETEVDIEDTVEAAAADVIRRHPTMDAAAIDGIAFAWELLMEVDRSKHSGRTLKIVPLTIGGVRLISWHT